MRPQNKVQRSSRRGLLNLLYLLTGTLYTLRLDGELMKTCNGSHTNITSLLDGRVDTIPDSLDSFQPYKAMNNFELLATLFQIGNSQYISIVSRAQVMCSYMIIAQPDSRAVVVCLCLSIVDSRNSHPKLEMERQSCSTGNQNTLLPRHVLTSLIYQRSFLQNEESSRFRKEQAVSWRVS